MFIKYGWCRGCPCVRKIWLVSRLLVKDRVWDVVEGRYWLWAIWDLNGETVPLVVTIAWLLWFLHNFVVHDAVPWNAGGIIDKAEGMLAEFRATNLINYCPPSSYLIAKWEPPSEILSKLTLTRLGIVLLVKLGSASLLGITRKFFCWSK